MKKLYLIPGLFILLGGLVFAVNAEQEEIDFLLFQPNSSDQFVNENQATVQLNNLANYLMARNPAPGQIYVYGYAAAAVNDIEPVALSRERALFVIGELQRRGIKGDLFSDPIGYGSVDLWGNNTNENEQSPNRRVRIVLDGKILTPETLKAADSEITISSINKFEDTIPHDTSKAKSGFNMSWIPWLIIIAIAVIIALILLLMKKRKRAESETVQKAVPVITPVLPSQEPEEKKPEAAPVISQKKYMELDEEEIRRYAYGLFQERNCQHGYSEEDWYRAERELRAKYEAMGYIVLPLREPD